LPLKVLQGDAVGTGDVRDAVAFPAPTALGESTLTSLFHYVA